jgi:Holliday junction resolvasome RuvABC ATP-dependent DNA helicase subunit
VQPRWLQPFLQTVPVIPAGEPNSLLEDDRPFGGNESLQRRLDTHIEALLPHDRLNCLFVGAPSMGKTTLARIAADLLQMQRYGQGTESVRIFELMPHHIPSRTALDHLMRQLEPHDIVFSTASTNW